MNIGKLSEWAEIIKECCARPFFEEMYSKQNLEKELAEAESKVYGLRQLLGIKPVEKL